MVEVFWKVTHAKIFLMHVVFELFLVLFNTFGLIKRLHLGDEFYLFCKS